jgi:hypothetical protein
MAEPLTFSTRSERIPTLVASLVFLVPGVGGLVFGPLTWFGLTWVENPANGLLIGLTCAVWAVVGVGVLRFRRWVLIDVAGKVVERGTRTLFRHPAERFGLERFGGVVAQRAMVGDHGFYVVALAWAAGARPAGMTEAELWLQTFEDAPAALETARTVSQRTGLPLADRTAG